MGNEKGNGYGALYNSLLVYFRNFGGGPGDSGGNYREVPQLYGDGLEGLPNGDGLRAHPGYVNGDGD